MSIDRVSQSVVANNSQEHVWACSEECQHALLFELKDGAVDDLVDFMIACQSVTILRGEEGTTNEKVWRKAAEEVEETEVDTTSIDVLRYAYDDKQRKIYSILQDTDPCPMLYISWLQKMASGQDLVELFWGWQVFTLLTNRVVAQYLLDGKLALTRNLCKTAFFGLFKKKASLQASLGIPKVPLPPHARESPRGCKKNARNV